MAHLGFPPEMVIFFIVLVAASLALDLYVHRRDGEVSLRSACLWSCFWVLVALAFGAFVLFDYGAEMAALYFTGYVLEEVLSVDNLFVMMAIFSWFGIPGKYRHRVLYWGVIGAIFCRLLFVAVGTELFALGPVMELLFAAIVGYTAVMMLRRGQGEEEVTDYSGHVAYRLVRRFLPVWPRLHGHDFLISRKTAEEAARREGVAVSGLARRGARAATPLFLCLAVIEVSDVLFAFDSVPAVIAVSREPLIVFSAMIFAILGLRSLYFVLEALSGLLVHLEKAVVVLLFFVSLKLVLSAAGHWLGRDLDLSPGLSLIVVLAVLGAGIAASLLFPGKRRA